MRKVKKSVTAKKAGASGNRDLRTGRFLPGNKPAHVKQKGEVSLKTRIVNDMLASYFEGKVKGPELLRGLPETGNRGIRQYLDMILVLVKANGEHGNGIEHQQINIYLPKQDKSDEWKVNSITKDRVATS